MKEIPLIVGNGKGNKILSTEFTAHVANEQVGEQDDEVRPLDKNKQEAKCP